MYKSAFKLKWRYSDSSGFANCNEIKRIIRIHQMQFVRINQKQNPMKNTVNNLNLSKHSLIHANNWKIQRIETNKIKIKKKRKTKTIERKTQMMVDDGSSNQLLWWWSLFRTENSTSNSNSNNYSNTARSRKIAAF